MQQKKTLITALATLVLLSPAAGATWMAYGSYEPDTPYDDATLMFADPPSPGDQKIYFNAYSMMLTPPVFGIAAANPNVGALQTQIEIPHNEYHEAILGVWVDCNQDGYIGMAETAAREYRSELLLDTSVCPPTTGSIQKWAGGHNYNNIVTELIPISRDLTTRDTRVFRDDDARVWGDFHRPDERPTHRSCALNPQPRGTYQSTGGAMNYVDCRVDILGLSNQAFDLVGDPLGLRYSDADDARTGTLGQFDTFGTEDSSHSAVKVWDCDQPPIVRVGDELNASGLGGPTADESGGGPIHDTALWGVAPSLRDTSNPTIPATLNETSEGLEGQNNGPENNGCDTSDDRGADFYGGIMGEADFNGVDPNRKIEADWNFGFATSNRGGAPVSVINGGNAGMNENDLGLSAGGPGGSRWVSDSVWLSKTGPGIVKADLASGGVGVADAYWLTFYAYVGSATTSRGLQLPGGSGVYGSWHCGPNTSGIHNGWNCDPEAWYVNPDGSPISSSTLELDPHELARVGQPYNLRDVDCYDGGIGSTGVGVQPAFFGDNPCP